MSVYTDHKEDVVLAREEGHVIDCNCEFCETVRWLEDGNIDTTRKEFHELPGGAETAPANYSEVRD